jgi:hypothetical protein
MGWIYIKKIGAWLWEERESRRGWDRDREENVKERGWGEKHAQMRRWVLPIVSEVPSLLLKLCHAQNSD